VGMRTGKRSEVVSDKPRSSDAPAHACCGVRVAAKA